MSRKDRINVRLAHLSWVLTEPDDRLATGVWSTRYLDIVSAGLFGFGQWLDENWPAGFGKVLNEH